MKLTVSSFIIRIVHYSDCTAPDQRWTGLICHVQSGKERRILDLEQAQHFIEHIVSSADLGATQPSHLSASDGADGL